MSESRLAQLATSPLLQNFAVTASQQAIRPVGNFIAPICEVPDLTFRYKVYSENNRFRVPATKRQPGSRATVIGFSATDASLTLEPNALDFPIPNADQLSDEGLQYSLMEAQSVLADASALALENEIVTLAQTEKLAKKIVIVIYGSEYWKKIINFDALVDSGVISPSDLDLFKMSDSPEESFEFLKEGLTRHHLGSQQPKRSGEAAVPEIAKTRP